MSKWIFACLLLLSPSAFGLAWESVTISWQNSNRYNHDPANTNYMMWGRVDNDIQSDVNLPDFYNSASTSTMVKLKALDKTKIYTCQVIEDLSVPSPIGRYHNVYKVGICTPQ